MTIALTPSPASTQIPWRKRADLQAVPQDRNGLLVWGIKDPVTLRYYELGDEAFFVLDCLDGRATMDSIRHAFHQRYRPRTLCEDELRGFLGQLLAQELVLSQLPGHGPRLVNKGQIQRTQRRWMKMTSLLALRFRGVNPDRFLSGLLSWTCWLFTPWALAVGLTIILGAILLVVVQFDELLARLPTAQALMTVPNLLSLSLVLAAVKVLHELGHGLTCKRFGGDCHELGVMLLVFTPTLYCNVSDIWMFKSKWQRIAVSAAGMWVEAVIAAICTWLWWFSEPGVFHSLCLNVMILCGLSTFVLNGNPLLRYDGYFVLADWCEIPNLQQQAFGKLRGCLSRWFCGFEGRDSAVMTWQQHWGLLAYGTASAVYRVMITVLMLWGLHAWLNPMGLGVVAQLLAIPTLGIMLFVPLAMGVTFLQSPQVRSQIRWPRFWWRTAATLIVLSVVVTYPFPSWVTAHALIGEDDTQRIYVTMPGTLITSVSEGQMVNQGDEIARLAEPRLQWEQAKLAGDLKLHQLRLEGLERQRVSDPQVAGMIPTLREAVRNLAEQLAQSQRDAERLILRAPQSGTVLAAAPHSDRHTARTLPNWTGSPLDERNRGCYLHAGTTYCLIGKPESQVVSVLISQDDINLVRTGQTVRLMFHEFVGEEFEGRIEELSAPHLEALTHDPRMLRDLPVHTTPEGVRPVGTWYQARIRLRGTQPRALRGASGMARIEVAPRSFAARMVRWFKQTFGV